MFFCSDVPLTHWSDAAEYAAYILNRSPTRANIQRTLQDYQKQNNQLHL